MQEITHKNEGLEDKPPTPNKKWERVEYSQNKNEIKNNFIRIPPKLGVFFVFYLQFLWVEIYLFCRRKTNQCSRDKSPKLKRALQALFSVSGKNCTSEEVFAFLALVPYGY